MGDILVTQCECGYQSEELHIGYGHPPLIPQSDEDLFSSEEDIFEDILAHIEICYCKNCEIITTTNTTERKGLIELLKNKKTRNLKCIRLYFGIWIFGKKPNCCPKCSEPVSLFNNDREIFCPKCKSIDIELNAVGEWY